MEETHFNKTLKHTNECNNAVGATTGYRHNEIAERAAAYRNAKEAVGRENGGDRSPWDLRYHVAVEKG